MEKYVPGFKLQVSITFEENSKIYEEAVNSFRKFACKKNDFASSHLVKVS